MNAAALSSQADATETDIARSEARTCTVMEVTGPWLMAAFASDPTLNAQNTPALLPQVMGAGGGRGFINRLRVLPAVRRAAWSSGIGGSFELVLPRLSRALWTNTLHEGDLSRPEATGQPPYRLLGSWLRDRAMDQPPARLADCEVAAFHLLMVTADELVAADVWHRELGPVGLATLAREDAIGAGRKLHAGLRAVDDLRQWLTLTIADVARLADLSESTIYWWAEHPTSIPRPAKVDRLLALQAVAGGLVDELGEVGTRRWFRSGNPSPLDRLRNDPAVLPVVEEAAYDLLLQRANARLAAAGPARAVTDEEYQHDLDRLAAEEHDFDDPLTTQPYDPRDLEPEDRA